MLDGWLSEEERLVGRPVDELETVVCRVGVEEEILVDQHGEEEDWVVDGVCPRSVTYFP